MARKQHSCKLVWFPWSLALHPTVKRDAFLNFEMSSTDPKLLELCPEAVFFRFLDFSFFASRDFNASRTKVNDFSAVSCKASLEDDITWWVRASLTCISPKNIYIYSCAGKSRIYSVDLCSLCFYIFIYHLCLSVETLLNTHVFTLPFRSTPYLTSVFQFPHNGWQHSWRVDAGQTADMVWNRFLLK